jgi:hypothetical protein
VSYHSARRLKLPTVGAEVAFDLAGAHVVGTVVEVLGPIGPGGRRMLRVSTRAADLIEPFEFEVPEDRVAVN